jgi:rubrerythrin
LNIKPKIAISQFARNIKLEWKKQKTIHVLNKLIISNNDRIKGYQAAAKETEEQDLKSLFTQLITTSQKCNQEL